MHHPIPAPALRVPAQAMPIARGLDGSGGSWASRDGVEPSATPCAELKGLARQLCYAVKYGVTV
jgi:hypothetical protein